MRHKRAIKIHLVDPQQMFTEALVERLSREPEFEVTGSVCAEEAGRHCAVNPPNVLVLSWGLPDPGALHLARSLRQNTEGEPFTILVADLTDDLTPEQAIAEGAHGYVNKRAGVDWLAAAIRAVADGQVWASWDVVRRLMAQQRVGVAAEPVQRDGDQPNPRKLSPREIEVLQLAATGLSTDGIAEALFVEVTTIKTHLLRINRKLGVNGRLAAVMLATELGMIEQPGRWGSGPAMDGESPAAEGNI